MEQKLRELYLELDSFARLLRIQSNYDVQCCTTHPRGTAYVTGDHHCPESLNCGREHTTRVADLHVTSKEPRRFVETSTGHTKEPSHLVSAQNGRDSRARWFCVLCQIV